MKKAILTSSALLSLILAGWGVYHLRQARLWTFSTGTSDGAFLGTTFGMSPAEVIRTLSKHGAHLLTSKDYTSIAPNRIIPDFFIPTFSDDREKISLYMPSIEMFESKVDAEFTFREARLAFVGVYFNPIASSKQVVDSITQTLRSVYGSSKREDSVGVPGAYTLHFKSETATPSLWVNLTDTERPIIILYVSHPKTETARKRQLEDRERAAFGVKK